MKKFDSMAKLRNRRSSMTKKLLSNITTQMKGSSTSRSRKKLINFKSPTKTPIRSFRGSMERSSPLVASYRRMGKKSSKLIDLTSHSASCRSIEFQAKSQPRNRTMKNELLAKIMKKKSCLKLAKIDRRERNKSDIPLLDYSGSFKAEKEFMSSRSKTPEFQEDNSAKLTPLISPSANEIFAKKKEYGVFRAKRNFSKKKLEILNKNQTTSNSERSSFFSNVSISRPSSKELGVLTKKWDKMNHFGKKKTYKTIKTRRHSDGQIFNNFKSVKKELFLDPSPRQDNPSPLNQKNNSEIKLHILGAKKKLELLKNKNEKKSKTNNFLNCPKIRESSSSQDTIVLKNKKDEEILLLTSENATLKNEVNELKDELISLRKHLTKFLISKNDEVEKMQKKMAEMHRETQKIDAALPITPKHNRAKLERIFSSNDVKFFDG